MSTQVPVVRTSDQSPTVVDIAVGDLTARMLMHRVAVVEGGSTHSGYLDRVEHRMDHTGRQVGKTFLTLKDGAWNWMGFLEHTTRVTVAMDPAIADPGMDLPTASRA